MRMSPQKSFGIVIFGGAASQSANFIDFQVSEYPVMTIPAIVRCEQTKKKKHVANADAIGFQMRLRRACLAESPTSIREYRVFVAKFVGTNTSFGHVFDDISESSEAVACLRASLRWDREANRLPINDRRWSLSGRAIEAFSAEDQSHSSSL